jgi:short-subunit dehydrogenase
MKILIGEINAQIFFMKKCFLLVLTISMVLKVLPQSDTDPVNNLKLTLTDTTGNIHAAYTVFSNRTNLNTCDLSGDYALVAGGSKGIGYAIAEALAKRKYNLILIARHPDSLLAAKSKLESQYLIHVETLSLDLAKDATADSIANWCLLRNIHLKVLCNVAGFGGARDYLLLSLDTLRYMVRLNIESCMALSLTLLPLLEKNAPSFILNVASMAGFAPIPVKNIYSATKSAVVFFSYSLRYQLKEKHISVSCLSPGPVFTKPEIEADTKKKLGWFGMQMAVPVEKVGEIAVRNTLKGKMMIVPGMLSKISAVIIRVLPRRWITAIYSKVGNK